MTKGSPAVRGSKEASKGLPVSSREALKTIEQSFNTQTSLGEEQAMIQIYLFWPLGQLLQIV